MRPLGTTLFCSPTSSQLPPQSASTLLGSDPNFPPSGSNLREIRDGDECTEP